MLAGALSECPVDEVARAVALLFSERHDAARVLVDVGRVLVRALELHFIGVDGGGQLVPRLARDLAAAAARALGRIEIDCVFSHAYPSSY